MECGNNKAQGSKLKAQGSRLKAESSKFKARNRRCSGLEVDKRVEISI